MSLLWWQRFAASRKSRLIFLAFLAALSLRCWAPHLAAQTAHGYIQNLIGSGLTNTFNVISDAYGNVYIADSGNNRVLKETLQPNGTFVQSVIASGLNRPTSVAVDVSGNVYISDQLNNRVLKETLQTDGTYNQSIIANGSSPYNLSQPWGVAVDMSSPANVFVCQVSQSGGGFMYKETPDASGSSYTQSTLLSNTGSNACYGDAVDTGGNVYALISNDSVIKDAYSGGSYTYSVVLPAGTLNNARGIGLASNGDLYAANINSGNVVKEVLSGGSYIQTVAVAGLNRPQGVSADGRGNIYIADTTNNRVIQELTGYNFRSLAIGGTSAAQAVTFSFETAGTLASTAYSVSTLGASALDFRAASSQLATQCKNQFYLAGATCTVNVTFNPSLSGLRSGSVMLYGSSGSVIATVYLQGIGVGPQVVFMPGTQSTVASGLNTPNGVAIDASGNVYVGDTANNQVLIETLSGGSYIQSVVASGLNGPVGVAVDGSGKVYIADTANNQVLIETLSGGSYTQSVVASGLNGPVGVAVDGSGNIYIADTANNQVLIERLQFGGDYAQSVVASGLSAPKGVAVDASGNVYISDTGNNQVLAETLGVTNYRASGYTQSIVAAGLSNPQGLAVDGSGSVYIVDSGNHRVIKEALIGGSYSGTSLVNSGLTSPSGLAVDGSGNVYIGDSGANQVFKESYANAPSLQFNSAPVGQASSDSPKTVTVANIGNAPLAFSVPGSGTNPSISTNLVSSSFAFDNSSTCPIVSSVGSSGALALGSSCTLAINFVPAAVGPINGQSALTDNTLNLASTTQTIALSGIGLQATQTIIFPAPASPVTYGVAPITLTATASSGLTVTYTLTGPATLSGSTLVITGAGTVTVTANQAGNATYSPATPVSQTIVINRAVLTVTADSQTRVFGAANPALTYLITGLVNGDTLSVVSGIPVPSTTATTLSPVGQYPITVTVGTLAAANYSFAFVPGTLTVLQATGASSSTALTVSPSAVLYGDTSTLTAVVSPTGATGTVTFTAMPVSGGAAIILGTSSAANSGTAVWPESALAAGTYNIVAVYSGDTNIGGSTSNAVQLTVSPRTAPGGGPALTVTATDASRTTLQSNAPFSYVVSGPLVNGDSDATAVTGTPVYSSYTGSIPGSYPITIASGLSSQNYVIAFAPGTLTVVITSTATTLAVSPASSQYGDAVTLTATVTSRATGTVSFYDSSLYLGQATITGSVATLSTTTLDVGTHTITAVYNGDATYASSSSSPATATVAKKTSPSGGPALTVSVQDTSRGYGRADPQFVYVVTGALVNDDTFVTAVTGVPVYATTATPASPANSTYPITVSGLISQNYVVSYVGGTLTIVADPTTTALSVSVNSVEYGDPLTLTATVTSGATGTVSFVNGSNVLGQATLSGGIATLATTMLPAGTYVVTAIYQGDGNYISSSSGPVQLTVTPRTAPGGGPALTVIVNNASRAYGVGNPAFTYTVTGMLVNNDTYASAVTGVPVYSTTATVTSAVGSYPITVSDLNSMNYVLAYVNGTLSVTQKVPAVVLSSSLNPTSYGQSVTFTASVPAGATGTMTFLDGIAVLCSNVTISSNTATCTTSILTAGTHPIAASYSGDINFDAASSTVLSEVVNKATSGSNGVAAVTLASSLNPSSYGQSVTFTSTVPAGATGTVTFLDGTVVLCSRVTISGNTATCKASTLTAGTHPIAASYSGDTNFNAASSTVLYEVVNRATPGSNGVAAVTLASSLNPSSYAQSVTFTASVPAGATGTVTFNDGITTLGTGTLSGGAATFTTSVLAAGTHPITAMYSGDSNFNGAISAGLSQVVVSLADFAIAATPASQIIPPGASITYTVNLVSVVATFNNVVTLTATGLPPGATYTFTTSSVIPGVNGASSTFTIAVPRQNASAVPRPGSKVPFALAVLLLPLGAWRRGRKQIRLVLVLLAAFAGFSALTGCGTGGYFAQPQQSYTVTVTGTSGPITHSTTVTLTVE